LCSRWAAEGGGRQGDLKELESMKDVHGIIAALKSKNEGLEKALASQQQQGAAAAARTWEKEREALLQVRRRPDTWRLSSATRVVERGSFWRRERARCMRAAREWRNCPQGDIEHADRWQKVGAVGGSFQG